MIYVIASISVKEEKLSEFIEIFKSNIPNVMEEQGCIEYFPTIDLPADIKAQQSNENVVTIIEKWQTLGDLKRHISSPHMLAYREKVKGHVEKVSLRILQRV